MRIPFKTVKQFVAITLLLKTLVACSSDDLLFEENKHHPITKSDGAVPPITEIYNDSTKNGAIIVGSETLGNPYNVDTLKKAYQQLYPNGNGQAGVPGFHPTHYQIRLLPVDSTEFQALISSNLILTTLPLDKNIVGEGAYYFDPQLEAQGAPYTWQYTIVPVTEQLPNIRHEVLAEICAPNDGGGRARSVNAIPADVWQAIEERAHDMCGVEPSIIPNSSTRGVGNVGMPGYDLKRVFVWDDKANRYIPAKGAKVVFWKYFSGNYSIVDANGNYQYPGNSYTRVEIQWEGDNRQWIVYDGVAWVQKQAIYACNTSGGTWTFCIKGGKQQTFATVTRALHRFYNEYNSGLPVPLHTALVPLSVICIDGYSSGYLGLYTPGNKIEIWGRTLNNIDNRSTQDVFATTAHELGHLIHYRQIISEHNRWNGTEDIIIESWGRYVQWLSLREEYYQLGVTLGYGRQNPFSFTETEVYPALGNIGLPGQPAYNTYSKSNAYNYQVWPFHIGYTHPSPINLDQLAYSPLFIDLVDGDNQWDYYRVFGIKNKWPNIAYKKHPNDQVNSYLPGQIISALRTATNLNQLKENIKNARFNSDADKVKIDTLFNRYVYYWNRYK